MMQMMHETGVANEAKRQTALRFITATHYLHRCLTSYQH